MTGAAVPRRKLGWVIYAAALTVFVVIGEARNIAAGPRIDAVVLADWVLSLVLLVALWGYALRRPIGSAAYWRVVFWIVLAATGIMLVPVAAGSLEAIVFTAVLLALVAPAYVAAYLYGHRSSQLWNPPQT